jgi:hypothetical protein
LALGLTCAAPVGWHGRGRPRHRLIFCPGEQGQIKLIQQLDEEDKKAIFRIISTMVTKNKFKDFFQKNVAAL